MVKHRFNPIETNASLDGISEAEEQLASHSHSTDVEETSLSRDAQDVAEMLRSNTISKKVLDGVLRCADASLILLTGTLAYLGGAPIDISPLWLTFAMFEAAIVGVILFQMADLYQANALHKVISQVMRLITAWALVFAALITSLLLLLPSAEIPQTFLLKWFSTGAILLIIFRMIIRSFIVRWTRTGRLSRRAVLVGGGQSAADLIAELERQPNNDIEICGIFDDRANDRSPPSVSGYQKLGNISDLVDFARIAQIDMLLVTIPIRAEKRILQLLEKLWVLPVDIRLSAHADKLRFRQRASSFVGAVPFVDVLEKPIADWDTITKRAFDLFFASLSLLLLFPVMIATAIIIKLDSPGPVIFRQQRYGFNNELIDIFKFRSMHQNQTDSMASKLVTKNDPRVTRVGRFIRKASIDELPQLVNVLMGQLSLVGPRPHALSAKAENRLYENVVDGYFARHKVKPGVTGWAQIKGWRGETDTEDKIQKRVECDIYYIENWSVFFDLYILLKTPFSLLKTENAY
ncbi:UDP-glucose:undecaprenyl-phosphate glucose-1-phosphate transferase [Pseudovibrio axinellae]|uniref:UDP-glucose:undecaprenyl-phosphate glucose-1-phosphate transferase n=1 Tax=Pseudovibrio axinellae TaxID=989403 RepID=A0A165WN61_9HYPH|nr:undecaprenyl-phosphate glucose phosphotransferase [Pseudovibrio axinellae]KZL16722.1 UDP-glucose:undecaprenyl-phosphate glucose-1-phosphate transferase [Pseudovibrio axinellae]SEQ77357.1 Undecaprenyl-phosphate glucose phosphotransferase [Pseudovibrio axinellae]